MAYNTAPGRAEYTATAGQTVFPFVFKIYVETDIKVYLTPVGQTPDDTADLLTLGTDYTVVITGDSGGSITLLTGATLNDAVTLKRDLPVDRTTEYQTSGDLLATTLNADQDYQTYLIGDKEADNERALRVAESVQGVDTVLPNPEPLSFIRWNADADKMENVILQISSGTQWRESHIATAGQTIFTVPQDINADTALAVFVNGSLLHPTDYTTTNNVITLLTASEVNDEVDIIGGEVSGVKVVDGVVEANTIADMLLLDTSAHTTCIVKDLDRGGTFNYDSTQSAVNNGGTIFDGWVREYSGAVNVKWFGAVGDGVTDDTIAIQAAIDSSSLVDCYNDIFIVSTLVVTTDVHIKGNGTLKHKASVGNNSLIKCNVDKELILEGLIFDGNYLNQPEQTPLFFNFIWVSIGSLKMYGCTVKDTKGHAVRLGNIDDFNASLFAHDCEIDNCRVVQQINTLGTTLAGDCIRVERTQGAKFTNNFVYGGYSGIRTQLYCKDLEFYNNDVGYVYPDVGITVAMSERLIIMNNNCHNNESHGYEIDAVVDCKVMYNYSHDNGKSGFYISEFGAAAYANSPVYEGAISDTDWNGYNYSAQVNASTYVPNYRAEILYNNSQNNINPDRLIGIDGDIYAYNYINNPSVDVAFSSQLSIEGGTIAKTFVRVYKNTIVASSIDIYAIKMGAYQYTTISKDNIIVGEIPLSQYPTEEEVDLNNDNKYLLDASKRSSLLLDANDSTAKTGHCVTHTTTGNTTYPFNVLGSGAGEKLYFINAKVATGTQTAYVAVNLHDSLGAYVATIKAESAITLTDTYQRFGFIVSPSVSVGNELRPQLRIPDAGVTVSIQELNFYTTGA